MTAIKTSGQITATVSTAKASAQQQMIAETAGCLLTRGRFRASMR